MKKKKEDLSAGLGTFEFTYMVYHEMQRILSYIETKKLCTYGK